MLSAASVLAIALPGLESRPREAILTTGSKRKRSEPSEEIFETGSEEGVETAPPAAKRAALAVTTEQEQSKEQDKRKVGEGEVSQQSNVVAGISGEEQSNAVAGSSGEEQSRKSEQGEHSRDPEGTSGTEQENVLEQEQNINIELEQITPVEHEQNITDEYSTTEEQSKDGLQCRVKNVKCSDRDEGKQFTDSYDLRYHYTIHTKSALMTKLQSSWLDFCNPTNTCSKCKSMFQSREKLAFHIGAKHNEVDSILVKKGIPVPSEQAVRVYSQQPTVQSVEEPAPSPARPSHPESPASKKSATMDLVSSLTTQNIPLPEATVNYELRCQVCQDVVNTLTQLHQHCSNHFIRNIQSKFGDQISSDGKTCLICGYIARSRPLMVMHIGCKHGKINGILVEQGYKALPCPVAPKTVKDDEIQRKLVELKRERWSALGHQAIAEENVIEIEDNPTGEPSVVASPLPSIEIRQDIFEQGASAAGPSNVFKNNVTFGPDSVLFIHAVKKKF